jgi:hypothetical protein
VAFEGLQKRGTAEIHVEEGRMRSAQLRSTTARKDCGGVPTERLVTYVYIGNAECGV